MSADARKQAAAQAALRYVEDGMIVGVGTGSTVNHFIAAWSDGEIPANGSSADSSPRGEAGSVGVGIDSAAARGDDARRTITVSHRPAKPVTRRSTWTG